MTTHLIIELQFITCDIVSLGILIKVFILQVHYSNTRTIGTYPKLPHQYNMKSKNQDHTWRLVGYLKSSSRYDAISPLSGVVIDVPEEAITAHRLWAYHILDYILALTHKRL